MTAVHLYTYTTCTPIHLYTRTHVHLYTCTPVHLYTWSPRGSGLHLLVFSTCEVVEVGGLVTPADMPEIVSLSEHNFCPTSSWIQHWQQLCDMVIITEKWERRGGISLYHLCSIKLLPRTERRLVTSAPVITRVSDRELIHSKLMRNVIFMTLLIDLIEM